MQSILLLLGAIGAMDQLADLEKGLAESFILHRLNFSGHGGSAPVADSFSIKLFAEDVVFFLNKKGIESITVFGYSMGGYIAMYLAKYHPHKIKK